MLRSHGLPRYLLQKGYEKIVLLINKYVSLYILKEDNLMGHIYRVWAKEGNLRILFT